MSSLPASIKRIGSKTTEKRWRHHFPHYKSMGAFCCHGNQSFDPICPKTLRFKYTTKFSLPKIACPAIVYVEIVAVIDPFFVGVCLSIKVYCYNPTEICQQRLQWHRNFARGNAALCSLSPTPMTLHIKFDQDWPTGFRDIQVQKCEIFVTQGQVISKWVVWFGPKSNLTELLCLSWLPATLLMIW